MARNFTVSTRVARPIDEVFRAVTSRETLCRYFCEQASSDLLPGAKVSWTWEQWGSYPVVVDKVIPNERIEVVLDSKTWKKTTAVAYDVRVIMEFSSLEDGGTLVTISEEGWRTDAEGLKGSHDNCGGWQHMLVCLKGYMEHGIDLR